MPLLQSLADYATERCGAVRVEVHRTGVAAPVGSGDGWAAWEGDPCRLHPELHLVWTEGDDVDRFLVRPQLSVFVSGRVAEAPAAAGEPVVWRVGEVRLGEPGEPFTGERAVARRELRAGEPLTTTNVAALPDALGGSWVVARVRSGGLEIRSDGRLLADAVVGEVVRVWLKATDRVVTGTLVDGGTVELGG